MKEIPLTQGLVALVDDEDFEWLSQWKWHAWRGRCGPYYAIRSTGHGMPKIRMHSLILGAGPGQLVDHVNRNGLDNRRRNLRFCTQTENNRNAVRIQRASRAGFRGVRHSLRKFRAQIIVNNHLVSLGSFEKAEDAARAYDSASRQFHGAFGVLNFPEAT